MKRGSSSKPVPPKSKSKSRTKSKEKKFDPLQYLNSLIGEIHDHSHTVRKRTKSATKRQISSAMAHSTPHTERSVLLGSSKIRSKSSYSQQRRKSFSIRDPLKVNLNIVTEQDNIQFTESTIKQSENEVTNPQPVPVVVGITRLAAARKIQRAWRNYQTLKVVRKYYEFYRGIFGRSKELKEINSIQSNKRNQEQPTIKRQLQHTLKIRRVELRNSPNTTIKFHKQVNRALDFSEEKNREHRREPDLSLGQLHTTQLHAQPEEYGKEEYPSKQLQLIIDMFRNSQQIAAKEVQEKLNYLSNIQAQLALSSELSSSKIEQGSCFFREDEKSLTDIQGLSPLIFQQMETAVRQKYHLYKLRVEEQNISADERRKALDQLQGRMLRQMRAIKQCKQQYLKSIQQLREGMLKMQNDAATVDKMDISNSHSLRVRKSYSADTLIIQSIIEQVSFRNMDLDFPRAQVPFVLEGDFRRKKIEEGAVQAVPTSPPSVNTHHPSSGCSEASLACYQVDSDRKLRQALLNLSEHSQGTHLFSDAEGVAQDQQNLKLHGFIQQQHTQDLMQRCDSTSSVEISLHEHSFREGQNSRMIRECSEQLEEQIQQILVAEIAETIFKENRFWKTFKTVVQNPFRFKPVTDTDIIHFLQKELPNFYGSQLELLQRVNQKINPTTAEILRLIRDFDFQIDEYDLVLPQETFKAYRRNLQQKYGPLIKAQQQREVHLEASLSPELKQVVLKRGNDKKMQHAKFLSFERDLRIMYLKAVFNCYNELIIEIKSSKTFMNGRSSIGPGELSLALKEYNVVCGRSEAIELMADARSRIGKLVREKCCMPEFKNHRQLQQFQRQINGAIIRELQENEHKWVNYMDEVLQLWQQVSLWLSQQLIMQAANEISLLFI